MASNSKTTFIAILVTTAVIVPLVFLFTLLADRPSIPAPPTLPSPQEPTPVALPAKPDSVDELRAEVAWLREEVYRHRKAIKGIAGFMDVEEEAVKFGDEARPVRKAEETTSSGVRSILSDDPPDLYKKQSR